MALQTQLHTQRVIMVLKDGESHSVFNAARKLGAVSAAAAALLASSASFAHESDLFKGVFDRAAMFAPVPEKTGIELPPLILRSSENSVIMAGHRSHSSHRSHQSHASSSMGGGRPARTTLDITTDAPRAPAPKASKKTSPAAFNEIEVVPAAVAPQQQQAPAEQQPPANVRAEPKYKPPVGVNLENAQERFQLINLPRHDEEVKAFIKDLATGKSHLYSVGDELGDVAGEHLEYKVTKIDAAANTAVLRSLELKEVVLKKKRPPQ